MNKLIPALCLVLLTNAFADERPNILLIFADDIGYEALNSYGGLDFSTPRLSQMAANGIQFNRAYTSPVCTPSRVSLHTSLYTTRHRHYSVLPVHRGTDKKVDFTRMPTFTQLMRSNGYLTSVTGKWQLATLERWPDHIRESGFDSWCIWQIWRNGAKTLRHWNATFNEDGKVRDDIADRFGPDVLVDYVIKQMTEAKNAGKPFMIVHNELLPHFPIIDTPDDRVLNRTPNLGGMISYMDKLVGRLLDAVDELGIRDNTYVIFMGDNGTLPADFRNPIADEPGQGPHTRHTFFGNVNGGKNILGDAGSHVPLIVWGPDSIKKGTVSEDLIDVVDLFPTFCESSSTTIPDSLSIDGRSIAPQIHGEPGTPRAWVHQGLRIDENLFDGSWRLFRKTGELWDARSLPSEPVADDNDPEAKAARNRLTAIVQKISPNGSRPPEPFPAATKQPEVKADEADIVVYGDASGGVAAAVQAARMGKDVILISQYGHLGGLTSSGLGWTDIGNTAILGGISREFYHRAYAHYDKPRAWVHQERSKFPKRGQGTDSLDPLKKLASVFEPKVAEAIFDQMVAESGVRVIGGRIDLDKGVTKVDNRITQIHLEGGRSITAQMFIDASYEGDLLDEAGVSFRIGREANAEFNERGNGNTGPRHSNQLRKGIDPYIVKGDPSSGLLPRVDPDMGGEIGDADNRLQAYCYRMVLTDVEANRVPIKKPASYNELDHEILLRAIELGKRDWFFKTSPMPNRKTDSNNVGGVSTDYIGGNYGPGWNWATLNHTEREALAAKHRDYQLGMLWTLQNHPRVPESVRESVAKWGLPKDEFTDNNHWPYNLYVREARRMDSDFVMTEGHCRNQIPITDSVGMGAYTLDSHNTQRFVSDGMVRNEGDIQLSLSKVPYPISYRALTPRENECVNLLVPWALSSTHIAFGSIRMEPVFMILGQSAGVAASLAIENDVAVQKLNYTKLRRRLEAAGQVLEYVKPASSAALQRSGPRKSQASLKAIDPKSLAGVVIDDSSAELKGPWKLSIRTNESLGTGYHHDGNTRNGECSAIFSVRLPQPGRYEVRVSYTSHSKRATNVPVAITHKGGTLETVINQRKRPEIRGLFASIGTFEFDDQATVVVSNKDVDGYVVVDGVQWLPKAAKP